MSGLNLKKVSLSPIKRKRKKEIDFFFGGFYPTDRDSSNHDSDGSDAGDSGGMSESKKAVKNPDYSFDSWLKKVEKLGDDVNKAIDQGKKKDQEIDKKKKDQEIDKKKTSNKTDAVRDSDKKSAKDVDEDKKLKSKKQK